MFISIECSYLPYLVALHQNPKRPPSISLSLSLGFKIYFRLWKEEEKNKVLKFFFFRSFASIFFIIYIILSKF